MIADKITPETVERIVKLQVEKMRSMETRCTGEDNCEGCRRRDAVEGSPTMMQLIKSNIIRQPLFHADLVSPALMSVDAVQFLMSTCIVIGMETVLALYEEEELEKLNA